MSAHFSCEHYMEPIREMRIAVSYLDSLPYADKVAHEIAWPQSLLRIEIRDRLQHVSELCAPWFAPITGGSELPAGNGRSLAPSHASTVAEPPPFPPERHFACAFCGAVKTSPNGTGSDVVCCGEVGRVEEVEA